MNKPIVVGSHVVFIHHPGITGYVTAIEYDKNLESFWVFVELDTPAYISSSTRLDERVACLDYQVKKVQP